MSQSRQSNADKYIAAVVSGEIVTGELVRLACQRHVRDLADGHLRGLRRLVVDNNALDDALTARDGQLPRLRGCRRSRVDEREPARGENTRVRRG